MVAPALDETLCGWIGGAVRGWAAASEFCGFSRAQIQSLVDAGLVRRFPIGERGDWMFSRLDLAQALAEKHREYERTKQATEAGAGART
ncbi:MAG TPA: hypothetical protein VGE74_15385 [Gemmata sp.]